jgi:hypothetical protein
MQSTVTAMPQAKRRGAARPATLANTDEVQFLGRSDGPDRDEMTSMTLDEIENLLLRIHGRTDAIKACCGLTGATKGSLDMSREQLVALLDLLAEGIKTVAYEMQDTVACTRRHLGMYRTGDVRRF